ncbi:hypothetical protein CEXT_458781 [Caerostris extrusa]|uniref:Uncharacterized protein n=1 Tax=Caerostris extrusa TaxID=172846 RepID=A0AAV4V2T3_CAEEX|nr:hypothetical protein CEXT_458781 [Caerostris extrusa]
MSLRRARYYKPKKRRYDSSLKEKQISDAISNFKESKCEKLTRITGGKLFFPFSPYFVSQPSMQNVPSSIFKTDEVKLVQSFP